MYANNIDSTKIRNKQIDTHNKIFNDTSRFVPYILTHRKNEYRLIHGLTYKKTQPFLVVNSKTLFLNILTMVNK